MEALSNAQVAKLVGVHPVTMERWLATGKVRRPKLLIKGNRIFRLWDQEDVERLRRYKAAHARRRGNRVREAAAIRRAASKMTLGVAEYL